MPAGHEPGSIGMVRRVVLHKDPEQGLGLAVVGGKQLGVPILGKIYLFNITDNHICFVSFWNLREQASSNIRSGVYWRRDSVREQSRFTKFKAWRRCCNTQRAKSRGTYSSSTNRFWTSLLGWVRIIIRLPRWQSINHVPDREQSSWHVNINPDRARWTTWSAMQRAGSDGWSARLNPADKRAHPVHHSNFDQLTRLASVRCIMMTTPKIAKLWLWWTWDSKYISRSKNHQCPQETISLNSPT